MRYIRLVLLAATMSGAGCKQPEPARTPGPTSTPTPAPTAAATPTATPTPAVTATQVAPSPDVLARIHWLGAREIALDTNATGFMAIWNLPESRKLETQTLDRLSVAPWPLLQRKADTNAVALLRPLLDDVLQQECWLEIRQATHQPAEFALGMRLNDTRAALWETNLAAVLESLTGIHPVAAEDGRRGWSLKKHQTPNLIELTRAGEWTMVGAAQDHNALLEDLLARIRREQAPFAAPSTNFWLEASLDLRRVANAFSLDWSLPPDFPNISLSAIGDGTNVHTHGELSFANPLPLELEPWNIPIHLIHAPVTSFGAIRGFKPWLASLKAWSNLQIGPPPNQLYCWAEAGLRMRTYFAAPLPDAGNRVNQISDWVLEKGDPWSGTNDGLGFGYVKAPDGNGLEWRGLPYMWPTLKSVGENGGEFALLSLFPSGAQADWPPPVLPKETLAQTNLIAYGWEMTGPRVEAWLFISQFFRFVTQSPQLPFDSASVAWLNAVVSRLDKTVTYLTRTGPNQVSVVRTSSIGFTGIELQLLADWLESPRFPRGLCTFQESAKPPPAESAPPAPAPAPESAQ